MFSLAVCALHALALLHVAKWPNQACGEACVACAGQGAGGFEKSLIDAVQKLRSSWDSYWVLAVASFEHLAEYSRAACFGEGEQAAKVWQELQLEQIPQSLADKLCPLCADLASVAELCRSGPPVGGDVEKSDISAWQQAAVALTALREMVHAESSMEWPHLEEALTDPAPPAAAPQASPTKPPTMAASPRQVVADAATPSTPVLPTRVLLPAAMTLPAVSAPEQSSPLAVRVSQESLSMVLRLGQDTSSVKMHMASGGPLLADRIPTPMSPQTPLQQVEEPQLRGSPQAWTLPPPVPALHDHYASTLAPIPDDGFSARGCRPGPGLASLDAVCVSEAPSVWASEAPTSPDEQAVAQRCALQ